MNNLSKTPELAGIYESQGYFKDAFEIYSSLDKPGADSEIKKALERVKEKIQNTGRDRGIAELFEKWLKLIILKKRLERVLKTGLAK